MRLAGFDYRDSGATYSVTSSTCKRRRAFEDPGLAKIVVESIQWARTHRQARIFAYCVMPDHLHMVLEIGDPRYSLGDVVGGVKRLSACDFTIWDMPDRYGRRDFTIGYCETARRG